MKNHTDTTTPIFLMCPPDFFEIRKPDTAHGAANKFEIEGYREYLKIGPKKFRQEATKQWEKLVALYKAAGVQVVEVGPIRGYADQVFTADIGVFLAGVTSVWNSRLHNVALLSRFSNTVRQDEVPAAMAQLEKTSHRLAAFQSEHLIEGSGDNVYDECRDIFLSGYAKSPSRSRAAFGRSDIRAHDILKRLTNVEVTSLEVNGDFYHVDLSAGPLSRGEIICNPQGMKRNTFERFRHRAFKSFGLPEREYLIKATPEDAARGGCNVQCVDDLVVTPMVSDNLQDRIRERKYFVEPVDVSLFMLAGGAIHCMRNHINQRRIVGGSLRNHDFAARAAFG